MWDGPYGEWGSRKYLLASLDQSLKRLGLDYVDIFYSHRPDPNTPIEETMGALDSAVRQGKALYVGVSNYSSAQTAAAAKALKELGTPGAHPPAALLDVRPLDRKGQTARPAREGGDGLHRLLAARAGHVVRPLSRRHPRRQPRRRRTLPQSAIDHARKRSRASAR